MSVTWPITVTTRAGKGSPINAQEFDANLTTLRDACNELNDRVEDIEDGTTTVPNADKVDNFDASQTPQANQIPVLNSSGQLWLPFAQTPILVNGQDMMSRTFYVDAENGDDNNDGSSSAPFRTIKKACDSVSVGGYGNVYVKSDYTFDSSDLWIKNKSIVLFLYKTLVFKWGNHPEGESDYAGIFGVNLNNAYLFIRLHSSLGGKIIVEEDTTGITSRNEKYKEAIRVDEACQYGGVYFFFWIKVNDYNPIIVKDGGLVGIRQWSNWRPNFMSVSFLGHYSGTNRSVKVNTSNNAYLVDFKSACGAFRWSYEGGLTDLDGNNIAVTDVVKGIVKDTNGIPRNIVSNVVF